jgi:hypothetical protein
MSAIDSILAKHQLEAGELTYALKQDLEAYIADQIKVARIDGLDLILDKLPLQVDGHRLQIWRENDNLSWDIAYNTDTGNLKPIVWEQARYLSEAADQMLKRLKGDK